LVDDSGSARALIDLLKEDEVRACLADQRDDALEIVDTGRILARVDVVHEDANGVGRQSLDRSPRSGAAESRQQRDENTRE
jgi:hypothetical protein